MQIGIGVYVEGSAQAVAFYTKVFGLTLGYHVLNEDGSYFHSELMKGDAEVLSVVERKGSKAGGVVQLGMELESPQEVQRVFNAFCADGAKVDMPVCALPWSPCAASVIDRFGVWWYFSSLSHRPEEDFKPE